MEKGQGLVVVRHFTLIAIDFRAHKKFPQPTIMNSCGDEPTRPLPPCSEKSRSCWFRNHDELPRLWAATGPLQLQLLCSRQRMELHEFWKPRPTIMNSCGDEPPTTQLQLLHRAQKKLLLLVPQPTIMNFRGCAGP